MISTIKVLCLVVALTQVVLAADRPWRLANTITDQSGTVALIAPDASKSGTLVEFA